MMPNALLADLPAKRPECALCSCGTPLEFRAVTGPDGCLCGRYSAYCPACESGRPRLVRTVPAHMLVDVKRRQCRSCAAMFETTRPHVLYCSEPCRVRGRDASRIRCREQWRADGLCLNCGQPQAPGYKKCRSCVIAHRRTRAKRRAARQVA